MNKLREAIEETLGWAYWMGVESSDGYAETEYDSKKKRDKKIDDLLKLVAKELLEGNEASEILSKFHLFVTGVDENGYTKDEALQAFENHIKSKLGVEDEL